MTFKESREFGDPGFIAQEKYSIKNYEKIKKKYPSTVFKLRPINNEIVVLTLEAGIEALKHANITNPEETLRQSSDQTTITAGNYTYWFNK
jgi:hypothetical protein